MMAQVVSALGELDREVEDEYIADLLDILTYAPDTRYKDEIARYLEGPGESWAVLALSVLCTFYGLTKEYKAQLARIIEGVLWDPFSSVQEYAIGVAIRFLKQQSDEVLFGALIYALNNQASWQDGRDKIMQPRFCKLVRVYLETDQSVVKSHVSSSCLPFVAHLHQHGSYQS